MSAAAPVSAVEGRVVAQRSAALDGVRGIAALAVLFFHAQVDGFAGGLLGVDLFFVLSGYLITRLLLAERTATGRVRLARFWARRAVRLWPPLAAMLLLGLAFARDLSPDGTLRGYAHQAFSAATWSTDIAQALDPAKVLPLGHTWTLAIEEQFYLLWPLLLLCLLRTRVHRHVPALLVGAAALSWVDLIVSWPAGAATSSAYVRPDTRAVPILVGCALALLEHQGARPIRHVAHPAAGLAGLGLLIFAFAGIGRVTSSPRSIVAAGVAVVALGGFLLVGNLVRAPDGPIARSLGWRPLATVGLFSYSLYLIQTPLGHVLHVHGWFVDRRLGDQLAVITMAITAGAALWALVERPLRPVLRQLGATAAPGPRAAASDDGPVSVGRPTSVRQPPLRWIVLPVLAATPLTFVLAGAATAIRWNNPTPAQPRPAAASPHASATTAVAPGAVTSATTPALAIASTHEAAPGSGSVPAMRGAATSSRPPPPNPAAAPTLPAPVPTVSVPTPSVSTPPVPTPPLPTPPLPTPTLP